ncbi:MAG: 16S rRNA (adenine(1518)-N(6)/adenine(1519)-N(6))-dimethyltransferase RsmA [Brevundimonas sp.]|jgi:16S rRNA (adenine1518-N6/adenine1519-N6)-dimethyltransferase|uniref:16S rRNA (adenine(1518)-N(6)/adenine(1519)-N(6))- dimethyltransferase RsmA n=1 Tax=Brevundimonas sp. TaxID=1871086 RepID=UPI00391A35D7
MGLPADLPSLRESLDAHGLMARKSFGQHFLLDLNVTRKIVRQAMPFDGDAVIEVGPGPGGLTRALLESDAGRVIAIEKDRRFIALLDELSPHVPGRFTLIEADALGVDETQLLDGARGHVVSNLPYNVGTPLLIKWLTGKWRPRSMILMFQYEVARRIVAGTGEDAYGRLGIIAQAVCHCRLVMELPARAFTPPPKVDSAVVHLVPRDDAPSSERIQALEQITAKAFGQRRKMLRSSLKAMGGADLCAAAGIDADARAESVPVEGFIALADAWLARR